MNYKDIMEILKDYGRHTGFVWLNNVSNHKSVMLKYDSHRRYFMSQITERTDFDRDITYTIGEDEHISFTTVWNKRPTLTRLPQDVFMNNVEYLLSHGYSICF